MKVFFQRPLLQMFYTLLRTPLAMIFSLGALASCSTYKPDIAQGNIVSAAQLSSLKAGMSRQQVQQALGTPLLQDAFNAARWDYVYRTLSGKGVLEQRVLTVFFSADNTVSRWTGQEAPNQVAGGSAGVNTAVSNSANALSADAISLANKAGTNQAASGGLTAQVASLGASATVIDLADLAGANNPNASVQPASFSTNAIQVAPSAAPLAAPLPSATTASNSVAAPTQQAAANNDAVINELVDKIESWRSAWQSKDTARYVAHYASDYKGDASTPATWAAQRKRVIDDAGDITLKLANLQIIQTANDEARASFTQSYQSRRLNEVGEKSLFFKRIGGEWKIAAERFIKQN